MSRYADPPIPTSARSCMSIGNRAKRGIVLIKQFFVELSADAQKDTAAKWTVQSDAHLSFILDAPDGASVFDRSIQHFEAL